MGSSFNKDENETVGRRTIDDDDEEDEAAEADDAAYAITPINDTNVIMIDIGKNICVV